MLPFERYEGNGRRLLSPLKGGDGACYRGYGLPVFAQCGTAWAYRGREMRESYEAGLDIAVDHVIPRSVPWYGEHRDWIGNLANMVTC